MNEDDYYDAETGTWETGTRRLLKQIFAGQVPLKRTDAKPGESPYYFMNAETGQTSNQPFAAPEAGSPLAIKAPGYQQTPNTNTQTENSQLSNRPFTAPQASLSFTAPQAGLSLTATAPGAFNNFPFENNLYSSLTPTPSAGVQYAQNNNIQSDAALASPRPQLPVYEKIDPDIKGLTPDELVQAYNALAIKNEGQTDFTYLDKGGNKTIGDGININNRSMYNSVNWLNPKGEPGRAEEIEWDWQNISQQPKGYRADFYKDKTKLRISEEEIKRLYNNAVKEHIRIAANRFPGFESFPPEAQLCILDMEYNLKDFNSSNWPHFFDAVSRRDWEEAAKQSNRYELGEERNARTAALCRAATQYYRKK